MRYPDKKRLFLHGGVALCCPDLTPQLRFGSVFGGAGRNFAAGPGGGEKNLSAWKTVLRQKVQLSPQPLGALRWELVIWATFSRGVWRYAQRRGSKSMEKFVDSIISLRNFKILIFNFMRIGNLKILARLVIEPTSFSRPFS